MISLPWFPAAVATGAIHVQAHHTLAAIAAATFLAVGGWELARWSRNNPKEQNEH